MVVKKSADLGIDKERSVKARFTESWRHWADKTTLHGVKVICDTKDKKTRRILRLISICGFCVCMILICYLQTSRYLQHKTVTEETIVFEEKLEFPAVTICSHTFGTKSMINSEARSALRSLFSWPVLYEVPVKNADQYKMDDVVRDVTNVTDTFVYCTFDRAVVDCAKAMRYRFTNAGVCYTFNGLDKDPGYFTAATGAEYGLAVGVNIDQNNFVIARDSSVGLMVLVHPRSEEPDMTQAIRLSPGFTHYVTVKKHEYNYLPSPVKAFDKKECVETEADDFSFPLQYFPSYSRYWCLQECLLLYVNNTCQCIGPFFTGNTSSFRYCSPVKYQKCHERIVTEFELLYASECHCPIPCHTTKFETKLSSAYYPHFEQLSKKMDRESIDEIRQTYLAVRVYYDTKIVDVHKQVLEFEFTDLIGSFGGYLGLAVGASLMTLLEIIEQVIISVIELREKNKVNPK